jgi:hypothetical protein
MPQTIAGQQTSTMPTPNFGSFQSGFLPDEPLMTEYRTAISLYVEGQPGNPGTQDLIAAWCELTIMDTIEMSQRSMEFTLAGKDTGRPDPQHVGTVITPIVAPKKFWLASAVNQDAWWNGMTPERLREHTIMPLQADRRLCNRLIIGTALTGSGWYNADQTPPPYLMNTFDSSHDHYISYDQDGIVTPENHSYAKWHIGHHGVPDQVVCITNSATRCAIEQEYGGFQTTADYENLPLIQDLNKLGFTYGTPMSGVPTLFNDAVPTGYALYIALSSFGKPMMWRHPLNDETKTLIRMENNDIPNVEFKWWGDYIRFGWPTIVRPEMGVAMKLDATGDVAYAAPSGILAIAA